MATHYQGPDAEINALNAFIVLMRAANSLSARMSTELAKVSLTESQFGVLEALHHLGPLSQGELGRKLLKTGANMTLVVDNLEKRGLVERTRNQDDRRFITVHLTAQGSQLIAGYFPEHAATITRLMSVLTSHEQHELRRMCRKLGTSL
jgi:MarR family transcriptional regulator, 2-MHQ and catechol-resistance regulon repressor